MVEGQKPKLRRSWKIVGAAKVWNSLGVSVPPGGVAVADSRYGFNEYRVVATFKEPKVFDTRADLLVTGIMEPP